MRFCEFELASAGKCDGMPTHVECYELILIFI